MPYWMTTAAVTVAALATVTWLFHRAVRRNCPYLVGRALAPGALGRLARVGRGTEIDIVDGGANETFLWERLLERWLKKGAAVRWLGHAPDGNREAALRRLAAKSRPGALRLFVVKQEGRESEIVRETEDFHFAVFCDPDQLWLEGNHPAGESCARDCEYVPRASGDERWKARREDFTALLAGSEEVELTAEVP